VREKPCFLETRIVSAKSPAFVGMIAVAAFAVCGPASARDTRVGPVPQTPLAPWYERFTFGSELRDGANAWVPRGETRKSAIVDSRSRWGVTFGVSQEPRADLPLRAGQSTSSASAGAFFQISPKFRVGGTVTIPDEQLGVSVRRDEKKPREPGVKVESAFRF
jgi:hypothetical protein